LNAMRGDDCVLAGGGVIKAAGSRFD